MRTLAIVLTVIAIALIAALPALSDNYLLRLGTMGAMYAVLALSWNIIGGFAGYPSFSTAAFFGLGAYSGAILQGAGLPMPMAWAAAGLIAMARWNSRFATGLWQGGHARPVSRGA